jgi:hypothetical protein
MRPRDSVRRGDLRRYVRPSSPDVPRIVVILSSDSLNSSPRPWVLGMELQHRDPGDILAIPVAGHGWAYVRDFTRLSGGLCARLHGAGRGHGQLRIAHHVLERWAVQRASAGTARGEQHQPVAAEHVISVRRQRLGSRGAVIGVTSDTGVLVSPTVGSGLMRPRR